MTTALSPISSSARRPAWARAPLRGSRAQGAAPGRAGAECGDRSRKILAALDFDRTVAHGGADLAALVATVLDNSNRLHHPRYFGLPGGRADAVVVRSPTSCTAVLNSGMAVYEMGPAGTAIERGLLRWMRGKIGWGAEGDGGHHPRREPGQPERAARVQGARRPGSFKAGVPPGLVLLASEAARCPVARAAAIMGLGGDAVVKVAVDDALRIVPGALSRAYEEVKRAGKRVLAVVANAGATPNGAFEPLRGRSARSAGGRGSGSTSTAPTRGGALHRALPGPPRRCRARRLAGLRHAQDARHIDAGLRGPRQGSRRARRHYEQYAPYLRLGRAAGRRSVQLAFEVQAQLSLKLFFNLASSARPACRARRAPLRRCRRFHGLLARRPAFECFGAPQSSILCFRVGRDSAGAGSPPAAQIVEEGFSITRTTLRGGRGCLVIGEPAGDGQGHLGARGARPGARQSARRRPGDQPPGASARNGGAVSHRLWIWSPRSTGHQESLAGTWASALG